jgi:hypothetical protein
MAKMLRARNLAKKIQFPYCALFLHGELSRFSAINPKLFYMTDHASGVIPPSNQAPKGQADRKALSCTFSLSDLH